MPQSLSDDLILVFNQHYEQAWRLLDSVVILNDKEQADPDLQQRQQGEQAIVHFQKCLEIVPDHWPVHFGLGKTYQGLRQHPEALASFTEALEREPNKVDVAREASIAAMDAGQPQLGASYSAMALSLAPTDAGLMCNHAVNLLVVGDDAEAKTLITKALAQTPEDEITQNASHLIQQVSSGERERPTWQSITGH